MGDIAEELLPTILDPGTFSKYYESSNYSANTDSQLTNNETVDSFSNFDDAFMNPNVKEIPSNHVCKKILYIPICQGTSVRTWDVLLFLPNLAFVIFLAIRWSSTKRKLLATHSPVYRTFHFLVAINALVALLKGLVAMSVTGAVDRGDPAAEVTDKSLWLALQFLLMMTEICVLVLGIAGAQLDSKRYKANAF